MLLRYACNDKTITTIEQGELKTRDWKTRKPIGYGSRSSLNSRHTSRR